MKRKIISLFACFLFCAKAYCADIEKEISNAIIIRKAISFSRKVNIERPFINATGNHLTIHFHLNKFSKNKIPVTEKEIKILYQQLMQYLFSGQQNINYKAIIFFVDSASTTEKYEYSNYFPFIQGGYNLSMNINLKLLQLPIYNCQYSGQ